MSNNNQDKLISRLVYLYTPITYIYIMYCDKITLEIGQYMVPIQNQFKGR